MPDYSIEVRSLNILGGVASHNFLVLRDERGREIAELHGLATDRETGKVEPIGYNEEKHSLRVWHYAHDRQYAESHGVRISKTTYIGEGQDHVTVLKADKEEVLSRWNAAVAAKEPLNALNLNYPSGGVNVVRDTVNSNSTYRTLSEIMGVPVHDFAWKVEPGLDYRMVDKKRIEELRTHDYPVLDGPSIKENGRYKLLSVGEQAQRESAPSVQQAQFDARDPAHHGYANYSRIRQSLEPSIADPQKLDNVSASAYRDMVANPLVKQADYVGIHNGHVVVSYTPFGLGREPMFNAYTEVAKAQDQPAQQSLNQAQQLSEARTQTIAEQQRPTQEQAGPALGIGARTT